ncbi:transglutaminase-like domain-containing protein [Microbulbifer epialgicus]|uniref:Transglutaminase family protein n=1 Tax=Microbulbifer epialgicus TaxID=393907 RepID=A0ABV4P2E8_9GAMM
MFWRNIVLFSVFLFGSFWSIFSRAYESTNVTLAATITVENNSEFSLQGYTHRVSIPVEDGLQQKLVAIRYEYPEMLKYLKHRRGGTRYLEFRLDIPARSTITRIVNFDLTLYEFDYRKAPGKRVPSPPDHYIKPRKYIESNSESVRNLAQKIEAAWNDDASKLKAAFEVPQEILKYQVQSTKGALSALKTKVGDCTEYASLFVALARSMGYPARVTSEFLFTERKEFSQPNHHAAEVYLHGRWIPVDPNLALDSQYGYGFGIGRISKITLTRDFTWVWSNLFPKRAGEDGVRPKVTMDWVVY